MGQQWPKKFGAKNRFFWSEYIIWVSTPEMYTRLSNLAEPLNPDSFDRSVIAVAFAWEFLIVAWVLIALAKYALWAMARLHLIFLAWSCSQYSRFSVCKFFKFVPWSVTGCFPVLFFTTKIQRTHRRPQGLDLVSWKCRKHPRSRLFWERIWSQ